MLEEFNLGCNVAQCDIGPDVLFSNIDRIAPPTLLSLGYAHGISFIGGREDLLNTLVLHVTCGACAEHSRTSHPGCSSALYAWISICISRQCEPADLHP